MRKIFVAGHNGMVGSAICRKLKQDKSVNLLRLDRDSLDLTNQQKVHDFLSNAKPDEIYLCAAKVGGIYANESFPADFILNNLLIQTNVIDGAFQAGIKKLLFMGSSCIYPRNSRQPIKEKYLLTKSLEPTNEYYAVAKIAGIKLCQSLNIQYGDSKGIDYRAVMPTNLYGPNDTYHNSNSHVIPALIQRFHEAKIKNLSSLNVWGSGRAFREFLHVDDLAEGSILLMNTSKENFLTKNNDNSCHVNIGSGEELTIKDLAILIKTIVGFNGEIVFDQTYPDGTPRKLLDSSIIRKMGWRPKIHLEAGIKETYKEFLNTIESNFY